MATKASLTKDIAAALGRRVHVLEWAISGDDVAAGLSDAFAVRRAGAWTVVPWDEVEHGRWDPETKTLSWTVTPASKVVTLDAAAETIVLDEPRRLPELFHDRVQASIVCERAVRWNGGQATIVARRNPGRMGSAVRWTVVAPAGTALDTPVVDAAIADALRRASAEY